MSDGSLSRLRAALAVFAPGASSTTAATVQLLRVAAGAFDESDLRRIADRLAGGREPAIAGAGSPVRRAVTGAVLAEMDERTPARGAVLAAIAAQIDISPAKAMAEDKAMMLALLDAQAGGRHDRHAIGKVARLLTKEQPDATETVERRLRRYRDA